MCKCVLIFVCRSGARTGDQGVRAGVVYYMLKLFINCCLHMFVRLHLSRCVNLRVDSLMGALLDSYAQLNCMTSA